ncbi:DNA glycosylase AlkZ-like family protein [Micromonospora haikouensis]|uniref:DNA glycosylase AlkZ-like family protein n=1 Tax=Micromonospora haikouensis TaxID=686309 RepID=UPI0033DB63D0
MLEISQAEARVVAVAAQGLHLAHPHTDATAVLRARATIQLDTIQVVRRSHELVLLARGVADQAAQSFLDERATPTQFEYWGHAASVLPLELWPYFALRRRRFQSGGWSGPAVDPAACDAVRAAVTASGGMTVTDLGGAKGSGWYRSAPAKWAAEWLLATGEFVCVARRRFSRLYQPVADVLPASLQHDPDDATCLQHLTGLALRALGIGTADDIADYFRLPKPAVTAALRDIPDAEPVAVQGWTEPAWITSAARQQVPLDDDACTPLSPFDSLIWHRPRARRLFGVDYVLEAYKPAAQRECGYFGMPVLAGTDIIGRIALRASKGTAHLEGQQLIDGHDPDRLRHAAHTAAAWASARLSEPATAGSSR